MKDAQPLRDDRPVRAALAHAEAELERVRGELTVVATRTLEAHAALERLVAARDRLEALEAEAQRHRDALAGELERHARRLAELGAP